MTQIPKMNPEGFEVAAKVWNDRYVELSKNVAGDQEKQTKHLQLLADEIQGLLVEKANLIAACDEALNWADANARWFDISTAPWREDVDNEYDYRSPDSGNGIGQVYKTDLFDDDLGEWLPDVHVGDVLYQRNGAVSKPTHWRPVQNPPLGQLPEPLERLGEVLRKVKEVA